MSSSASGFSFGDFVWWHGVVENRADNKYKTGRARVRIFGYHSKSLDDIKEDQLPWAIVMQPAHSASISGIGRSPTGIVEGTHVFGFFLDGHNAQTPIIIGTFGGIPAEKKSDEGFFDPNGVYPSYPLGESDTNRLARNENIGETIVPAKRENVTTGQKAFGGSFTEPATPYNARYPLNHVWESESGHISEVDDTPGAERIHNYHKSGTFNEVHPDGTKVSKVVKDKYTVTLGDDHLIVEGNCFITVKGNANVRVEGNSEIETMGNKRERVHGNSELEVLGNYSVRVTGVHQDQSSTLRTIRAPRINLN